MITFEYINKFMYFIVSTADEGPDGSWLYCSGVSMSQFVSITRGRHGLASNPAMRGLQLNDLHMRRQLHENGAQTKNVKGNPCDLLVPKTGDWYRQLLFIDNATEELVREVAAARPAELVRSIFSACMVQDSIPPSASFSSVEMEDFLAALCDEYSKQAGWPTCASVRGFRK
ncbi:MAG TPA: hypothetical protein VLH56_06430 [Dissulfurispiraceae bacterium]|nr:hypothetical protein [Dissulfurispiraceae bacterium]